jgi:hypothetical protein
MMQIVSLAGITLDSESAAKRLRVSDQELVRRLIASAQALMAPAAAFRAGYVNEKRDDGVVVDSVAFTSRVLRRNLEGVGRVFPFVLTIGKAMDEIIDARGDILEKYLLDEIANTTLREARSRFEHHLRSVFALDKISCMAPGSLEDWPIEQQKPLFSLLPGVETELGVWLTESFLMLPRKSISGIYFPSEATFFSCQLCPRERCDGRKARYDAEKAGEYGLLK